MLLSVVFDARFNDWLCFFEGFDMATEIDDDLELFCGRRRCLVLRGDAGNVNEDFEQLRDALEGFIGHLCPSQKMWHEVFYTSRRE